MRTNRRPVEAYICFIFLVLMTIFMTMEIVARYIFNTSLIWPEELTRYLFIWFVFISASYAVSGHAHIRIEAITNVIPSKLRPYFSVVGMFLWLIFSIFVAYHSFQYSIQMLNSGAQSPTVKIPMGIVYLGIPVGFSLMSIRLVIRSVREIKILKTNMEQKGGDGS